MGHGDRVVHAAPTRRTEPAKSVMKKTASESRADLRQDMEKIKQQLLREILRELKTAATAQQGKLNTSANSEDQRKSASASQVVKGAKSLDNPQMLAAFTRNTVLGKQIVQALRGKTTPVKSSPRTFRSGGKTSKDNRPYGVGSRDPEPCDLVAIITHRSNPVDTLSMNQVRKIYSGEYRNWSEVGGPDVAIKVITVRKRSGNLEKMVTEHLKVSLTPHAQTVTVCELLDSHGGGDQRCYRISPCPKHRATGLRCGT